MDQNQKIICLKWVRQVITEALIGGDTPFSEKEPCPSSGAFVTLHKNSSLRGCIGQLEGQGRTFSKILKDAALSAAFRDPRFPPVTEEELPVLTIEISRISPFEEIDSPDLIIPGKHGVFIHHGFRSAVFLPQVATEQGWDRGTLLLHLASKAGLPGSAVHNPATRFSIFTAEVWSEKDFF